MFRIMYWPLAIPVLFLVLGIFLVYVRRNPRILNMYAILGVLFSCLIALYGGLLFWGILADRSGRRYAIKEALTTKNMVPLVVIGSGPAGLSAALYGARSAIYTVVFEGKTPGGQLTGTTHVENWPGTGKLLGSQLIDQAKKQAESFGAVLVKDSITTADLSQWPFKLTTEEGYEIAALAVIIATGAQPKLLNDTQTVPGEKEYWGHGVTTCAICDAPFYRDKKVIVVGGGDSAVEEATLLTSYAEKVTVIVRGSMLRAAPVMQLRLKDSPKINVLYNTEIDEILGDGSKVTGVRVTTKASDQAEKKNFQIPVEGVFLAIGHRPNTEIFKKQLSLTTEGYIVLDPSYHRQQTSQQGVFAAGDVADHVYRQAGVAAGDGIKAALDAISFLQKVGYTDALGKKLEKNFYEPFAQKIQSQSLEVIKTNADFDKQAKEHKYLVADVGAKHCSSCQALTPIVQSVAAQFAGKVQFVYIDLGDEPQELIERFHIKAIPSVLVFKGGALIARYDHQLFTKRELTTTISRLFEL